ncbi:MAG: sensor histidine kinase [Terriglobales bacterium]
MSVQSRRPRKNHGVRVVERIVRTAVSLGVVGSIVVACIFLPHVHVAAVVLTLLLAVIIIASRSGFVDAAIATVLGAALLAYFFLPPDGWAIESVEQWMVFFTFLVVALLASYFATRATRQTKEAVAQRREMEKLSRFGQELRIEGNPGSIVAACLGSLVRTFQVEAAIFFDLSTGEITRSGQNRNLISAEQLREAALGRDLYRESATNTLFVPISSGGELAGSLAVCGGSLSELTFRAIADRIEAGLEKVRAQEEVRRAEDTQRKQELKTALLDSLVHEIKTPLSIIKTAASSLLSIDSDAASRRELAAMINEQSDRMDASISETFWTARVEAGTLQSGKGPRDIRPLVQETLHELMPVLGNRTITVEVSDSLPPANCDFHMIKGVLKELLTNALKYSPSDSPLTVSMVQNGDKIITSVADSGRGIQQEEERHIFERHYRGSVRGPGTGLGLAIAKTIVEAHGGQIGFESQPGVGSVFHFSLPLCHGDVA